jgi:hypothetical protein
MGSSLTAEPMSREDLETLRTQVSAFNRGDLEAWLATIHPDVSFAPISASIEGSYEGHDGLPRWFADNRESFESFQVRHSDVSRLAAWSGNGLGRSPASKAPWGERLSGP